MAKLSARGRMPVYTVVREYHEFALQARTDARNRETYPDGTMLNVQGDIVPLPESIRLSLTTRERVTERLMSDGTILSKHDVWFRPGPYNHGQEQYHTYGWKVKAKLKATATPKFWLDCKTRPLASGTPSPWVQVI